MSKTSGEHAMNADVISDVQERYAEGAKAVEAALCCPVDYDPKYLKIIPDEVIERDYGCGDPSRYVREGDVVLDLGSGGGKICFIAAQIVGSKGKVIGVDMTDDMLELARKNAPIIAEKIGYDIVEFKRGHIEDLKADLDRPDSKEPMIADNSIDVIVSNCVLNLVSDEKKKQLFSEIYRVLKPGGRVAISDIVSDEDSPDALKQDAKLWSGCISGALTEEGFVEALEEAGFYGITIDKFELEPWQIVEGIEYRSATYLAYKQEQSKQLDKNQAVIYLGPFAKVKDDFGNEYKRGERTAVSDQTFKRLSQEPFADMFALIEPKLEVKDPQEFPCCRAHKRSPQETKQGVGKITTDPNQASSCC